jgi:hypothetical protein
MKGEDFHKMIHTLFDAASRGDTTQIKRKQALELLPMEARNILGVNTLFG